SASLPISSLTEILRPLLRVARASIAKAGARRKRSIAAARGGCRVPLSPIRAGGWSDQPQTPACAPPASFIRKRGDERRAGFPRTRNRRRIVARAGERRRCRGRGGARRLARLGGQILRLSRRNAAPL